MTEPLTRSDINRRAVRIRITGKGDLPTIVALQIVNAVDLIRKEAVSMSGAVPTETDPDTNHVYITLASKEG